ncbi:MAG: oligoendopeptidase F [bacterium]|nr:oligoendopeptidase F [bacterium]
MKKRCEVLEKDCWRMEDLFAEDALWEQEYRDAEQKLGAYEKFVGHLGHSADMLYACLKFEDALSLQLERLYVYARQKSDEDTGNDTYQSMQARAERLSNQAAEKSSFVVPEILSMEEDLLRQYMKSDNGISHFRLSLERLLAKKEHTLPKEMEELLAQSYEATQGASLIFNYFNNADIRFPKITNEEGKEEELTHGRFIRFLESKDQRVRKEAFLSMYQIYRQFSNTLAATFAANVKQAAFYAKARKYASDREAALSANEVPESVYDNLIAAVRKHLPLMHRYVALRKKALGLDELHMYDLYVPIVESAGENIPFETAKEMVKEGLKPLGEEYIAHLQEGFDHRWIDVYENEGKRSGAYSWGAYGTHPYVLLNYNGTLDSVFTLAHEMGHALHSYYSDHAQPYTYAGYKIFVAEVASTCNESLLMQDLLKKTEDKKKRAYLLNHFLEMFKGTLFRQTMFAEFELWAHQAQERGEALTAKRLCEKYHRLNVEYFGPQMCVDEEIDYEWSRIPHFYTPFYVYQYATGISAAIAISRKILSGEEGAREGYFRFLQGGCSMTPIALLQLAHVDMNTAKPVEEALGLFEELLNETEALL